MNKRIEYIDAMRGLAMMMVVIFHCQEFCFIHKNILDTIINSAIQIPLFFMVSGFFASNLRNMTVSNALLKKFMRLIIPTALMLGLYCWSFHLSYVAALFKYMKDGYWFTYVLFGFIAIYLLTDKAITLLTSSEKTKAIIHILVGICIPYFVLLTAKYSHENGIGGLLSLKEYFNYFYFVLGAILYANKKVTLKHLNSNAFLGGAISLYIITTIVEVHYGTEHLHLFAGIYILLRSAIPLLLIWTLFDRYTWLSTSARIGRFLTLVGRRSIDVYFIHYYFLSAVPLWGEYFATINAPFIEYMCAIALSIPIIFASLGLGYVIRLSNLTSRLLLGVNSIQNWNTYYGSKD